MYRRNILSSLQAALADTPAVLLNGPRQTGKTTLAQELCRELNGEYESFDDAATRAAAARDPEAFLRARRSLLVIDEVQSVPGLFTALKKAVDDDRRPGRFLLTGSANVLALPMLSDSLAGRMEVRTLWPLSRGEITGRKESLLEALFAEKPVMVRAHNHENTARDIIAGGYPEALSRLDAARRDAWFAAYVSAILQRDVRDLARIEGLIDMPRLLALLAARSSGLMNMAEISRSAAIPHTTLKRYLTLLELTFLLQPLAAWSTNLGKRLVKSPKVHLVDSGLAAHLCGVDEERLQRDRMLFGQLLETFVVMELRKQVSWDARRIGLYHFRSTTGREVDAVLEGPGGRVVGIEVKASATIGNADFAGLEALAEVAGHRFLRGILLYDGSKALPFGDRFMAAPVSSLWAEWTAQ